MQTRPTSKITQPLTSKLERSKGYETAIRIYIEAVPSSAKFDYMKLLTVSVMEENLGCGKSHV